MGMYTGLRFRAILNSFGQESVESLNAKHSGWAAVTGIPTIWTQMPRANYIPFGAVCSMPDSWIQEAILQEDTWAVCCSLKNYHGEIQIFLEHVLPLFIKEPCEVEVLYEEWDKSDRQIILPLGTTTPMGKDSPQIQLKRLCIPVLSLLQRALKR